MKTQSLNAVRFVVLIIAAVSVAACVQSSEKEKNALLPVIEHAEAKAESGDADAQYGAGAVYRFYNPKKAIIWFRKAAEQGHGDAQYFLGDAYMRGVGVAQDIGESIKWLTKSAEQGQGRAKHALWIAYSMAAAYVEVYADETVKESAILSLKKSAEHWLGEAKKQHIQYWPDKSEGLRWFRRKAERGDVEAQFMMGYAYSGVEGVAQDQIEAVRWYRMAAEQGHAGAQVSLGTRYLSGDGVIQDNYEAYVWLSIAQAYGDQFSDILLMDLEENHLSRSEIRSAKQEAARRMKAIESNLRNHSEQYSAGANTTATPAGPDAATGVFENAWRSVVVIVSQENQGSGVIIRPNIVATNCHLVSEGGSILVYKSKDRKVDANSPFYASIHRADVDRDFCLLNVDGLWGIPATVRKFDSLKIGENVYGLGAPQGLDLSISLGLVSQLRSHGGNRYIQTDVAISPGSSGGGLFDSAGNLVGIMTAKISDESVEGIGFAIPADLTLGY